MKDCIKLHGLLFELSINILGFIFFHHHNNRLDMTLDVAETLSNDTKQNSKKNWHVFVKGQNFEFDLMEYFQSIKTLQDLRSKQWERDASEQTPTSIAVPWRPKLDSQQSDTDSPARKTSKVVIPAMTYKVSPAFLMSNAGL